MTFVKEIKRPEDRELLDMIGAGVTPVEIARSVPCSSGSVRSWLRRLSCTHDRKGSWFLPNAAPRRQLQPCRHVLKPKVEIRKSVLPEQFPFIRTHIKVMDDGSRVTLPDLSMLAAARAERDRRERRSAAAFDYAHPHTQER